MLRIVLTSLLMVNAIFWGIYPPADDSPHSLIVKYLGSDYKPTNITHLVIGTLFYILAVLIAQTPSIQHIWF